MILFILAFLGGALTILSPCILPVLPFVFGGTGSSFRRGTLPLLLGMALTFVVVSTLAVVGGSWAVHANSGGRWIALGVLALFALSLIFPSLAEKMTRPLLRLGSAWQPREDSGYGTQRALLLGVATGLLWAPCAGPILGLILTGAAIRGASLGTSVLLLAYALGASTSPALVLTAGGKLAQGLRQYLPWDQGIRKVLGVTVLMGVTAIAFGLDRGVLTRLSQVGTDRFEQKLLATFHPASTAPTNPTPQGSRLPALANAEGWINSSPLTAEQLRGKVVLIDFWTYSCINCLRTLPYLRAWHEKYKDAGFVIIGVHTPEFAFEKDPDNVRRAVKDLGLTYPIALDPKYAIWTAFNNRYWPAHYFIDGKGQIRHQHFGEGEYEQSEKVIQMLLAETAGREKVPGGVVKTKASGAQASAFTTMVRSPETYIGYARAENFASSPPMNRDNAQNYAPDPLRTLNQWGLAGRWVVGSENAQLVKAPGKIDYVFQARDVHLVLGPPAGQKQVRFRVRLDGKVPGENHGSDVSTDGTGTVTGERLYQLIRLQPTTGQHPHLIEIEFLDPGVHAFAFTFG